MKTAELLRRLADARRDIDLHESEFSPEPYGPYQDAFDALHELDAAERAALLPALDDPDEAIRIEATKALGELAIPGAAAALERRLDGASKKLARELVQALTQVSPGTALQVVVNRRVPVDGYVLADAATAAVQTHGLEAFDLVLASGITPWSEGQVAWDRLYALDPDRCARVFISKLQAPTRSWALGVAQLVAQRGGDWAREPFKALVRSDDDVIKRAAADALEKLGGADEATEVIASLATARGFARYRAVESAFAIGRRAKVPVGARLLARIGPHRDEQRSLWSGLARSCLLEWERPHRADFLRGIQTWLTDPDEEIAAGAVHVAVVLEARELVVPLVEALAHPRWYGVNLNRELVASLEMLGAEGVKELARVVERGLAPGATTREREIAARAIHRIGFVKDPSRFDHVTLLVRALREGVGKELVGGAASSLRSMKAKQAGDALVEVARSRPPEIAYLCVQALEAIGDPRVVDVALAWLAPFLEGRMIGPAEEAWMCASCVDVLGALPRPETMAALHKLLAHAEMRFRRDACDALGKAGDRSAVAWLRGLEQDRDAQVRKAATAAIARLASPAPPRP